VPPKAFLVLRCLIARPAEVVTKQELMQAAWPDTFVAEVGLNVAIRQLREAFGDDAKAPRFIETVHRRGFRWIAGRLEPGDGSRRAAAERRPSDFVGRGVNLAHLHTYYARAAAGQRQVVFVTGDPGIGKTAVVDHFLSSFVARRSSFAGKAVRSATQTSDEPRATDDVLICRGQCTESFIAGEAYRPIVEAIESLLRHGGDTMRAVFAKYAPTWLLQMPELSTAEELEELRRNVTASTGDRMQRELERAIEAASAECTIVLVL